MKKPSLIFVLFFASEVFADTNQAVKETNFNVALSHTEIDNDSMSHWRTTTLSFPRSTSPEVERIHK